MELIKKEDYEAYDAILPRYVVSITFKKKTRKGVQANYIRDVLKEEVRVIKI